MDVRDTDVPVVDVFMSGMVFLDIIFTGLPTPPDAGTEVWAAGMGSSPGGIANLAVATSRLGLRTSLAAGFGDDAYGDFCWHVLAEQEGVDLSRSRRFPDWHSPVTVSIATERDRSMVTHGHAPPINADEMIGRPPRSRTVIADVGCPTGATGLPGWAHLAREDGALIFADVGWDPSGVWNPDLAEQLTGCHAFMPNAIEAMAYTRTRTPAAAVRVLAEWVPLAVVTCGPDGALGIDSSTGEQVRVPSLPVTPLDPTGAGDVFGAGLVLGTLTGWPLRERLLFAGLCAGLAVQHFGGSLAAPGWNDITHWWQTVTNRAVGGDSAAAELTRRYGFVGDVLPTTPVDAVRRARATIARCANVVASV